MTRPAFDYTSPFNFEADVVLWDIRFPLINKLCQSQTDFQTESKDSGIIYADYNIERNRNQTSMQKLTEIENDLLNNQMTELEE